MTRLPVGRYSLVLFCALGLLLSGCGKTVTGGTAIQTQTLVTGSVDGYGACTGVEIAFRSSTTPPKYHYQWALMEVGKQVSVTMYGGYDGDGAWNRKVDITQEQQDALCAIAAKYAAVPKSGQVGGSTAMITYQLTGGPAVRESPDEVGELENDVAALLPGDVFTALRAEFDTWSKAQE